MFDIVTMGELLFDFSYFASSPRGNGLYEANPGGAPANVAVGAARLGSKTAFVGKIGNDLLSLGLEETLAKNGVNTKGLVTQADFNTAMTFVQLDEKGDRSFSFYRVDSADMNIFESDLNQEVLKSSRIFHFGSLTMTNEPSRSATRRAVEIVKESGGLISFDPNYRPVLWKNAEEARRILISMLPICDVLKVSEEELVLLSGEDTPRRGMEMLHKKYGVPLIFATFGPGGSAWLLNDQFGLEEAYDVHTIDTTGAGDSFVAAELYQIASITDSIRELCPSDLPELVRFASAASSLATTVSGAIPSLPNKEAVIQLLKDMPR